MEFKTAFQLLFAVVVAVTCLAVSCEGTSLQAEPLEVSDVSHDVTSRALQGSLLSKILAPRFRREAARLYGDFGIPRPCFGPKNFNCPHPEFPALCLNFGIRSPCSDTDFLTVNL